MSAADVAWMTASEIADEVRAGDVHPEEVVAAHLERIARFNPGLNAYVHVDRLAASAAGAMAGVTLAVKDSQPVAGMPWTWGSRRWRHRVATADAVAVARARAAGVAILGKANLPELAAAIGTDGDLFGPTHNPWRHGLTPGGSSGGSAAAVAAGLCTFAYGDDMGGSIRIPSSCCGVLGLRASPRRVPVEMPDPTNLSVPGPLARSVADLRLAFAVMTGEPPAFDRGLERPRRVAVVDASPIPTDDACVDAVRRAASALERAGHRLEPAGWNPLPVAHAYQVVRPCSVANLPGEPGEYGTAAGALIATGRSTPVREFLAALQSGLAAAEPLRRLVEGCDAVLTPTLGRRPMPIAEVPAFLSDAWVGYTQFVLPVSFSGLPAASVPAGLRDGLPVGVQLIGRPNGEWALLDLAEQLEAAPGFGFQRPPDF